MIDKYNSVKLALCDLKTMVNSAEVMLDIARHTKQKRATALSKALEFWNEGAQVANAVHELLQDMQHVKSVKMDAKVNEPATVVVHNGSWTG